MEGGSVIQDAVIGSCSDSAGQAMAAIAMGGGHQA
jgi:hypothetical protein